jgi:hypothetical protein
MILGLRANPLGVPARSPMIKRMQRSTAADAGAGRQAERTRLAWRRTVLTCGGVSLLMVHPAVNVGGVTGSVLAGVTAALWLALAVVAQRRIAQLTVAAPVFCRSHTPAAISGCVAALGAVFVFALLLT